MNSSNSATTVSAPFTTPRPGRPSLRTSAVEKAICTIIQIEGLSDSAAGLLAGISTSSVSRWKLEDEDFALLLGQARARFDLACLREIRQARKRDGTPDWRAQAWLLQNTSAEGYRKPARKGRKGGEPEGGVSEEERVTVTLAELEQIIETRLRAMLEELARKAADGPAQNVPEIPETPRAAVVGEPSEEVEVEEEEEEEGGAEAQSENIANVPEIPETRQEVPAHHSRQEARESRRLFGSVSRHVADAEGRIHQS